jgi:hypothetical protein
MDVSLPGSVGPATQSLCRAALQPGNQRGHLCPRHVRILLHDFGGLDEVRKAVDHVGVVG